MIMDSKGIFADNLAHNGSPTVVKLPNTKSGYGNKPQIVIKGSGLAGATGFTISHKATSAADTLLETHVVDSAVLNAGYAVPLPQNILQYVAIALTGSTSAGTWTACLQEHEGQTNQ